MMTLHELAALAATLDPTDRIEIDGDSMQAVWWNASPDGRERLVGMVELV